MTDKELRKLSRLELLELLLEASNENQKLNEKIEQLTRENKAAQNIENLSVMTRQVENTLRYANSLTEALKNAATEKTSASANIKAYSVLKEREGISFSEPLSDKEIYQRMLCFFIENDDKLSVFPDDMENAIRDRIRTVLEINNIN